MRRIISIIQAYAEGKVIQIKHIDGTWQDAKCLNLGRGLIYRIKPEPKYRPFKDSKECWAEMQKHQPFGFMKIKDTESGYFILTGITRGVGVGINDSLFNYDRVFNDYTFADGTPFGIKVEG